MHCADRVHGRRLYRRSATRLQVARLGEDIRYVGQPAEGFLYPIAPAARFDRMQHRPENTAEVPLKRAFVI
jgi:hypothetical protein